MTPRLTLLAVMTLLGLPAWTLADDGQPSQTTSPAPQTTATPDAVYTTDAQVPDLQLPRFSQWDLSFGWWSVWSSGSPLKTAYYQDLNSSPFWDVNGLSSDGCRTLSVTATGSDNATTVAKVYYYQPGISANVEYQRYTHELDHDPLSNDATALSIFGPPPTYTPSTHADPKVIVSDLGAGENYSMDVQEFKANIKAIVTDNLKVRVDLWGMERSGIRQVNAVAMCYNDSVTPSTAPPDHLGPNGNLGPVGAPRCHILSQPQSIDWISREIKPVIEWRVSDDLVLEYSRPMRGFTADDGITTRYYDTTGSLSYPTTNGGNPYPYAVVPSNYTQMDQLKANWEITDCTKAYAYLMIGNTVSDSPNISLPGGTMSMTRYFNNIDLRLTNTSVENLSVTAYGKNFNEDEGLPPLSTQPLENQSAANQAKLALVLPMDEHTSTVGVKGTWKPGGGGFGLGGLAIVGGVEYEDRDRTNMDFINASLPNGVLDEDHTITTGFQIGPTVRWSSCFDTYARYKYQWADQPLTGVTTFNTTYGTNTLLPQLDSILELGGDWMPSECFMFSVSVGIEDSSNHSAYANFNQQNYPFTANFHWMATDKLTLSGGYAVYSNFIAQNIVIGETTAPAPTPGIWSYSGGAQVANLTARYRVNPKLRLTGEVEYIHGNDQVTNSAMVLPGSATPVSLGSYSQVLNDSTHVTVGADVIHTPRLSSYYRYEFYNFSDQQPGYQSGIAQGILAGMSARF